MKKLIFLKGLPGSGKSTWAKEYQAINPNTVRVNKDDLRQMLHNGVHSKGRESFVLEVRDYIVTKSLEQGHDVIVDDTNFNPVHEQTMRNIAANSGTPYFEIKDMRFENESEGDYLARCIKNDLKRPNSVGEKVIMQMFKQNRPPEPALIPSNPDLYDAIIVDLDGTLALFGNKNPYERDFINDTLNESVANLLLMIKEGVHPVSVIIFSGRKVEFEEQTADWLDRNGVEYDELHMRPSGDVRKDFVVKQEMYEQFVKGKYNVKFVLDDRNQVVELWRSLGLPCFQVARGDF